MTPTWTGKAGEPVPAMLRHDWTERARCACGVLSGDVDPGDLCPAAVAQRLAELEAHEASLHKAVARSRRGTVRWLRSRADQCERDMERAKHQEDFESDRWSREAFNDAADAIARGDDGEWCEAHPETSPAPTGADAGRDPGSSEE